MTAAPVVVFQVGLPQGHLLGGVQALGAQRTPLKVTCGNTHFSNDTDASKYDIPKLGYIILNYYLDL